MVHGVFLNLIQPTICIASWKVFLNALANISGSSFIGYHPPESVSVFVRELFRRSADQLVVAQPGANASRRERIFWGFHNTGDDLLQEHVRYGDLRLYERLKMLPLLRQVRECGCDARLKLR